MNKAEILFDAITNVRPTLIEEAQNYRFRRRPAVRRYVPWLVAAACVALLVVTVRFGGFFAMGGASGGNYSGAASGDAAAPGTSNGSAAPQGPEESDDVTTEAAPPAGSGDQGADSAGGGGAQASATDGSSGGSTLPGAMEVYPTVMVNGAYYHWNLGAAILDALPEDSVYYGELTHVEGELPENDGEFVSTFDASGQIYVVPGNTNEVYLVLTTDWMEETVVRFLCGTLEN